MNSRVPWWITRGVPNPASLQDVKDKIAKTVSSLWTDEKRQERSELYKGRKGSPISKVNKLKSSIRMKANNPMKKPEVLQKKNRSFRETIDNPNYVHPNKGRKRPDAAKRMSDPSRNPMKDLDISCATWEKIKKTLLKKNMISEGESALFKILTDLKLEFVIHKTFPLRQPEIKYAMADAFIPSLNLCVEYDGFSGHYSESGLEYDTKRDSYIADQYGCHMVRIGRDRIFTHLVISELKGVFNELRMEKSPKRCFIGR